MFSVIRNRVFSEKFLSILCLVTVLWIVSTGRLSAYSTNCVNKITHDFTIICYYTGTSSSLCYDHYEGIVEGAETTTTGAISGDFVRCCVSFVYDDAYEPPSSWTHNNNSERLAIYTWFSIPYGGYPWQFNTDVLNVIMWEDEWSAAMDYAEAERITNSSDHSVYFVYEYPDGIGLADSYIGSPNNRAHNFTECILVSLYAEDLFDEEIDNDYDRRVGAVFAHEHGHIHGLQHFDQETFYPDQNYGSGTEFESDSGNLMHGYGAHYNNKLLEWQCEAEQYTEHTQFYDVIGIVEK